MQSKLSQNKSNMNIDTTNLDANGKVVLDHIYNQETPLHFYNALSEFDYSIPEQALPIFEKLISFLKTVRNKDKIKLIDLGSSYGVNGVLLKSSISLEDLFNHYKNPKLRSFSADDLLAHDKNWYETENNSITVIGADISEKALDYAIETNFIDQKLSGNFEKRPLKDSEKKSIENTDLIISTGCIGYVGHKTINELLKPLGANLPIMAHFVLRTISFNEIDHLTSEKGYKTYKSKKTFHQRNFASREEKRSTLDRLSEMSINPTGLETEGSYYANLYLSLPSGIEFSSLPEGIKSLF